MGARLNDVMAAGNGLPMDGMPDEVISQREFARRLGVDHTSVRDAIRNGRIEAGSGGFINWTRESQAWLNNRDESKVRGEEEIDEAELSPSGSLAKARISKERWTAELRRIEYEKAAGKLIDRDSVLKSIVKFCKIVREGILIIPDRVASAEAAALSEYLQKVLSSHLPVDMVDKILSGIDMAEIERITHLSWEAESSNVLSGLGRGPEDI